MAHTTIDLTADIIDTRDIIERIEEIEEELLTAFNEQQDLEGDDTCTDNPEDALFIEWLKVTVHEDAAEYAALKNLMNEMKGNGGDEQWRGDWYPLTLIRESYFTEYCCELVSDIGDVPRNIPSYIEIDWEATARNLMVDYTTVEIDGVTYFYR